MRVDILSSGERYSAARKMSPQCVRDHQGARGTRVQDYTAQVTQLDKFFFLKKPFVPCCMSLGYNREHYSVANRPEP